MDNKYIFLSFLIFFTLLGLIVSTVGFGVVINLLDIFILFIIAITWCFIWLVSEYLLDKKFKNFFIPLTAVSLISGFIVLLIENNNFYNIETHLVFGLLYFLSMSIIFIVYVVYPLVELLLGEYGTKIQRIIIVLLLFSSMLCVYYSSLTIDFLFYALYLAIFLNSTSKSSQMNPDCYPIVSTSYIINLTLIILLLTILMIISLFKYGDWGMPLELVLSYVFAIALVLSSFVYKKENNFLF
ncbi:hypothetical protein MBCUT_17020 [Methanobrevibacter cuticularis]|uniref:Uncharacterized protein n=1 Tax=Methanobrevibacter cuticularis TaxID=47311 RepID=A0A166D2J7_9EURY|nr:hypothetical protein [Methanobrevibacter cuticularis]KZX15142.1 hypothetical protein MBCUT_17020 [Methanobrevibacter cuticularis]